MQINNQNPISFKGFVHKSLTTHIKKQALRNTEYTLFKVRCAPSLETIDKENTNAESIINKFKVAMEKMHPATGIYKEDSRDYLVLRNSITNKILDIIRICDKDLDSCNFESNHRLTAIRNGRYSTGECPFKSPLSSYASCKWVGRSWKHISVAHTEKELLEVADHIKENAAYYDKKLGVDNISQEQLQTLNIKELEEIKENKLLKFFDKILQYLEIKKQSFWYTGDYSKEYKEALKKYFSICGYSDL